MKNAFNKQQALANTTIRVMRKWQSLDQKAEDAFGKSQHADFLYYAGLRKGVSKQLDSALSRLEKAEVTAQSPYNLRVLKRVFEQATKSKGSISYAAQHRIADVAFALIPTRG